MKASTAITTGPPGGVVGWWLLICVVLVVSMMLLGAITRLTGSGLSMVDWKPLSGVLPPLSAADWNQIFAAYQQSPEYREVNVGILLADFKRLFWFEYAHRSLGRLIGVVFALPLLFFIFTGRVRSPLIGRLSGIFVLGALQGLLGWYMVKSGLVDIPRVSPYRLVAHWLLAVGIFSMLLWCLFGYWLQPIAADRNSALRLVVTSVLGLVLLMLLSGALVAATKAGYAFNTFPKMGDRWIPLGFWTLQPEWRNLVENIATVQWIHRLLAGAVVSAVLLLWALGLRYAISPPLRWWLYGTAIAALIQAAIGVAVLLLQVPVVIAVVHQAGALVLLTGLLGLRYLLRRDG